MCSKTRRKIDYYIDAAHADERERIRKAGQAFVREHASYHNRLQQMLDIVFPSDQLQAGVRKLHDTGGLVAGLAANVATAVGASTSTSEEPVRLNLGAAQDQLASMPVALLG